MEIKEVTKDDPCRHCGKPDWCYRLSNDLEVCNRDNVADGWVATKAIDKSGKPFLAEQKPQEKRELVNTQDWIYKDRQNKPLIRVSRRNYSNGSKFIRQYSWTGKRWVSGYGSVQREDIPIYNYQAVRKAIANGEMIFYVEGEKCVDALSKLGFIATTNIVGSNGWNPSLIGDLKGANLVLCPDRDKPGLKLMAQIYKHFPDAQWLYADPTSKFWEADKIAPSGGYDIADWTEDRKLTQDSILASIEPCRTELLTHDEKPENNIDVDLHYTEKAIAALYAKDHYAAIDDCLYRFNGRYYEKCSKAKEQKRIVEWCLKNPVETRVGQWKFSHANPTAVNNIYSWLLFRFAVDPEDTNPPGLNLLNGTLRITWNGEKVSHTLIPHNPENIYTYCSNLAYDPKAEPKDCDRLLACLEPKEQTIFLRTLAAALDLEGVRRVRGREVRALLLQGFGNNGKDSLREAAHILFGDALTGVTVADCQQYDQGRKFPLAKLKGAKLSWSSENTNLANLDNLQALKAAITGDSIDIELKNQSEFPIYPVAVFLFNCNDFPSLQGGLEALRSRYGILKFKKTYKRNADPSKGELEADSRFRYDPDFLARSVCPALLNKILIELVWLVTDGINYDSIESNYKELLEDSNHLWTFCREVGLVEAPGERVYIGDLWEQLREWYLTNGILEEETSDKGKTKPIWHELPNKKDQLCKGANQLYKRFGVLFPNVKKERHTDKDDRVGQFYLSGCSLTASTASTDSTMRVIASTNGSKIGDQVEATDRSLSQVEAVEAVSPHQENPANFINVIATRFVTLDPESQQNLINQLNKLKEGNPMAKEFHYPATVFCPGQTVSYEEQVYTVKASDHAHVQLVGLTKAVPVWMCQLVEKNNNASN